MSLSDIPNPGSLEGPFLAGVMVGLPLLAITCGQTTYYYRTYPNDHKLLKLLVAFLFLLEATHTILLLHSTHFVYVECKVPANNLKALNVATGFAISVTVTALVTFIVQSFYAWRVHSLSKQRKWGKFVVYLILTMSLLELGCGIVTNVFLFDNPTVDSTRGRLQRRVYSVTLVATIICDSTISLSQVYFLNKLRSGFRSSENVINRLILFSINVGLLTSVIALCTLISFYATPATSIFYTVFVEINGKFYVNSMLVTLNSRKGNRKILLQSVQLSNISTALDIDPSNATTTTTSASTGVGSSRQHANGV